MPEDLEAVINKAVQKRIEELLRGTLGDIIREYMMGQWTQMTVFLQLAVPLLGLRISTIRKFPRLGMCALAYVSRHGTPDEAAVRAMLIEEGLLAK